VLIELRKSMQVNPAVAAAGRPAARSWNFTRAPCVHQVAAWLREGRKFRASPRGIHMARAFGILVLLVLAGCSGMAQGPYAAGPCTTNPGGYDCQVEMYQKAH
jgi:hypothetical protein